MSSLHIHLPPKLSYKHENGKKDIYIIHERIGHGSYGVVHRVTKSHSTYALKVISKQQYINGNEISIQKNLNHPNIVRLFDSFSNKKYQYIILEFCPGGTILDYLRKSSTKRLTESETRQILIDVINGLLFLHNRKIIHHDIKLENFIVGKDGKVKISDFGNATILKEKKCYVTCGTLAYMSPELIIDDGINGHGFEVDVWAVGVSAFLMLNGRLPFIGNDKDEIEEKIKNCIYSFDDESSISKNAKDFIEKIFQIDPKKRPSLIELIEHPFLSKIDKKKINFLNTSKCHSDCDKCCKTCHVNNN